MSESLADAVLLACTYHFKQPEASTSSNAVSTIFPRQLCCHGECMLFLCGCHGDPISQPSSCSHHVSAWSFVCLPYANARKKRKNMSSTGKCPSGLPFIEICPGIPGGAPANGKKKKKKKHSWLTFSLWHCIFDSEMSDVWEKFRTMASFFFFFSPSYQWVHAYWKQACQTPPTDMVIIFKPVCLDNDIIC